MVIGHGQMKILRDMLTRKFSKSEFDQQLHNRYYLKFTMNKIVREITRVFDDDVLWSQSNDK